MTVVRVLSASLEAHLIRSCSKLRVLLLSVGTCCGRGHASWLVPLSPAGLLLGQLQHAARGVLAAEVLLGTTLAAALVGVLLAHDKLGRRREAHSVCVGMVNQIFLGVKVTRLPAPAPSPSLCLRLRV